MYPVSPKGAREAGRVQMCIDLAESLWANLTNLEMEIIGIPQLSDSLETTRVLQS